MMGKSKYISELRQQKRTIEKNIKLMEQATQMPQPINDSFMAHYRKLNELRLNLKTVKSRLENYGKPRPGIEEYQIKID